LGAIAAMVVTAEKLAAMNDEEFLMCVTTLGSINDFDAAQWRALAQKAKSVSVRTVESANLMK